MNEVLKQPTDIFFMMGDPAVWVMKLSISGVEFNRKEFPDYVPDDFARDVVGCLNNMISMLVEEKFQILRSHGFVIPKNEDASVEKILGNAKSGE